MKFKNQSHRSVLGGTLALALLAGCSQDAPSPAPPPRSWKPIGEQLIDLDGRLRDMPFRVLLGFETDSDLVFLGGANGARLDESVLHSGPRSLALPLNCKGFTVRLASLLSVQSFPGDWTLAGAYFYTKTPTSIGVSYEAGGVTLAHRSVMLPARQWTPVLLDLSRLADPNRPPPPPPGIMRFVFESPASAVWCDDVILIDNARTLVTGNLAADGWTVRTRGFETVIDKPGHFSITVPTPDGVADAWQLAEVNERRARFTASGGKRSWVIYSDGRQYVDGRFDYPASLPQGARAQFAEQHDSPADFSVPEEMGRVERNSPGDRNNDGYNELLGTYQIKATGSRVMVTLRPKTAHLLRPVLEITGLPAGQVTGTFEGVLVENTVRVSDGRVLVELPGSIDRDVTVELKVR